MSISSCIHDVCPASPDRCTGVIWSDSRAHENAIGSACCILMCTGVNDFDPYARNGRIFVDLQDF